MADEYNRLAMYSMPLAEPVNHLQRAALPSGHPSNMLRGLRDKIPENTTLPPPQFPFDPRSMSMLNMLRSGLGTAANWLEGTHNPDAVEVGPDTIAPLGMIGMGAALKPASGAPKPSLAKKAVQQHLRAQEAMYGPLTGPRHLKHLAESAGIAGLGGYSMNGLLDMNPISAGVVGATGVMAPHVIHTRDIYKRLKEIEANNPTPRPESVTLLADNAKSSVPGTVVQAMGEQPNPVHFGSRNASVFDPPNSPARPFEADYPQGAPTDAAGRLTHDIDGRPLTAEYVAGRRMVGGSDVPLSAEDVVAAATSTTGRSPVAVASRQIGGDAGRHILERDRRSGSITGRQILYDQSLSERQAGRVIGHEFAHDIDAVAGKIPTDRLSTELRGVYDTLNNFNRSLDGTKAASWGPRTRPQDMGYGSSAVPRELMAEAIRAYMADPNYLKTVAPETAARIREYVNANPALNRTIQFNEGSAASSAPGLAASASQQPDSAVLDILSRYGLY